MSLVQRAFRFLRIIFMEGMLRRTESGERLPFMFSRRAWGSSFMLAGVLALVVSVIWFVQRAHFELDAVRTEATVLAVEKHRTRDNNNNIVSALTVEWTDQLGRIHVTTPKVRASTFNFPIGEVVEVRYDPDDPTDVRIDPFGGPWTLPLLFLKGGVLTLLLGRLTRGDPEG